MKKRIIALVLSFVMIFSLLSHIIVYADSNNYEYRVVNVFRGCKNNKSKYEKLLVLKDSSGNLYMSSEDIARYTIFYFDETTQTFYFDNNTAKNPGLKNVKVDKENNTIKFFSQKVALTGIIEENDDLYFPLAEILPYLNADICVYDDAIGIISDGISLWQILDGFNAESQYFDVDKELYNGFFTFAFVSTNYVVDTFFNPSKWRRATRFSSIASYYKNDSKEYSAIMKDYMVLESNTIAQASNKLSSITDALITGQETINTSELLNWIAIATNCLSEADKDAYYMYFGGRMESIAESARFINEKIGNNKFLSDDELLKKLGNTMLVLDKTVQCYSANKDCYEAIDKVYKNQEASIQKDTAIRLYNAYKTDFGKGISILFDSLEEVVYNEVSEYVIPDPVSIAYNLARLAFSLIGLDEVYGSAAVLLYVCRLQDDGLAAYKSYMKNLDYKYDTNEGIRLSLIYYLRMSQTCYGTLEKAYSYSRMKTETKECKNKQAEIDKIVASLLAAGNACMHDSIDKVKENVNAAKKAIKTATTYDGQEFIGTLKDIQLQNEQYKTNSFVDVYSTNLGGASSNKKPSISKNGYTYSYGDANKGEFTDVSIICEGYENKWIHYWIIKKDNKTGKSKAIIKDADGGIAVTDRFIYYLSNVYSEEGYQGFYGVEYVRTDLQGKNREVLYFSDYTPFGTGVGLAPSFLVTNDFLFISKEDLIRVDLSTKAQKIIIKDIGKKTSSDWMDIDFIYDGHYYFNLYDNENDYGADSNNLPDRCDGFFCYTEDSGISYIIAEYHKM